MLSFYINKINTQLHAIIALLSDYDKRTVYRNTLTASYVIYPEGGGIKRFRGYVKNGFRDILLQFLINNECPFISLPHHMNTFYLTFTSCYCSGISAAENTSS